ncbi:MAG: hypothetical protein RLZZ241_1475 [Bacteroidota bacterium]|jgi:hypothetical protein
MGSKTIFSINSAAEFDGFAQDTFRQQYKTIPVYREFCDLLGKSPQTVQEIHEIPFLPISFFKSHRVCDPNLKDEIVFSSSGTTGMELSKHYVGNLEIYQKSFTTAFERFYGQISNYCILALLPSYQERPGSSLIYMVDHLIRNSKDPNSRFLTGDSKANALHIYECDRGSRPVLLIGVSFALLDLGQAHPLALRNTVVMETGGMKGRRQELVREALHLELKQGFGVSEIHSEYGMTELLSQGYSWGSGFFKVPPWMRILIRDTEDPLSYVGFGKTGGLNIIDLANQHSCAFIATQDLGKMHKDETFEVLGRFDHSDIRGCNLLAL